MISIPTTMQNVAYQFAQVLLARLSYANLKVNQGWIKQNIDEVEHLYSSRFRSQAQERRSRGPKTLRTTSAVDLADNSRGADWLPPPIRRAEVYSSQIDQAGSHRDVPPSRPFAEANEDIVGSLKPSGPDSQYLDFTPALYGGFDPGISVYAPVDGHQPVSMRQGDFPSQSTIWHSHTTLPSNSASLHQPTHSMYTYLASPVAGSAVQFAGPVNSTITEDLPPLGESSAVAPSTNEHAWSKKGHMPHASLSTIASSHSNDQSDFSGTSLHTPTGTAGPQYGFAHSISQQYPLAPVPNITPRPDVSAPTFTSMHAAKSSYGGRPGHASINPVRGHIRNPSLKGEYSVSSVTMDDLDSHFGQ